MGSTIIIDVIDTQEPFVIFSATGTHIPISSKSRGAQFAIMLFRILTTSQFMVITNKGPLRRLFSAVTAQSERLLFRHVSTVANITCFYVRPRTVRILTLRVVSVHLRTSVYVDTRMSHRFAPNSIMTAPRIDGAYPARSAYELRQSRKEPVTAYTRFFSIGSFSPSGQSK